MQVTSPVRRAGFSEPRLPTKHHRVLENSTVPCSLQLQGQKARIILVTSIAYDKRMSTCVDIEDMDMAQDPTARGGRSVARSG